MRALITWYINSQQPNTNKNRIHPSSRGRNVTSEVVSVMWFAINKFPDCLLARRKQLNCRTYPEVNALESHCMPCSYLTNFIFDGFRPRARRTCRWLLSRIYQGFEKNNYICVRSSQKWTINFCSQPRNRIQFNSVVQVRKECIKKNRDFSKVNYTDDNICTGRSNLVFFYL